MDQHKQKTEQSETMFPEITVAQSNNIAVKYSHVYEGDTSPLGADC